jgi:ribosome-associated toxin RatA of RatAB toxin-antitoxin module
MEVTNSVWMSLPPPGVFDLVRDVVRWPDVLPHYRYVRWLSTGGDGQRLKMAARRSGLPVSWTSVYRSDADTLRLHFRHVGGATRGMVVEWRLEPERDGTRVSIHHCFEPAWPLVGRFGAWFICRFFVQNIAGKTLREFERRAAGQAGGS